jgi:hypothetical protein
MFGQLNPLIGFRSAEVDVVLVLQELQKALQRYGARYVPRNFTQASRHMAEGMGTCPALAECMVVLEVRWGMEVDFGIISDVDLEVLSSSLFILQQKMCRRLIDIVCVSLKVLRDNIGVHRVAALRGTSAKPKWPARR